MRNSWSKSVVLSIAPLWLSLMISAVVGSANSYAADNRAAEKQGQFRADSARPIRAELKLVLINVNAVDSRNRPVSDLRPNQFRIYENGTVQNLASFSTEDDPISAGIVFDASGSMASTIDTSRIAADQFLHAANPRDEVSLIVFGDRPHTALGFTTDSRAIMSQVGTTAATGQTALYDAIYLGLSEMKRATRSRKALLVISDGGDNHSRYTAADLLRTAKESDVQVYSIAMSPPSYIHMSTQGGLLLMQQIAKDTGGRYFAVDNADQILSSVQLIGRELHSVYVLGYKPTNDTSDGKWRKLRVQLALPQLRSSVRLYHRSGYYAPQ